MMNWKEITSVDEWQQLNTQDSLIVFKHSTTCPVSANALKEFEDYLSQEPKKNTDYVLVKVIESRPVSNQIAEDTGIKHESPQIIYLQKGEPVWNTSHWSITVEHMKAVLD